MCVCGPLCRQSDADGNSVNMVCVKLRINELVYSVSDMLKTNDVLWYSPHWYMCF